MIVSSGRSNGVEQAYLYRPASMSRIGLDSADVPYAYTLLPIYHRVRNWSTSNRNSTYVRPYFDTMGELGQEALPIRRP